ncbi:hypothetical protein FRB94_008640 [Tulasnella sp. JGI-2019a]|nr:hypothetical protein FRB94_008640 [Tulasnella sp. JGI-2019a]KAG9035510.1 hypothetical protein FRB95_011216 [Tulasnella sp. JGI-2019a]
MAIPIPQPSASAGADRWTHESAPAPFVPPIPLLNNVPLKSTGPHPRPNFLQYAQKPVVGVSQPGPSRPAAGPASYAVFPPKHHIQRSSASHVPVVPYPTRAPERPHARMESNASKLPPRPMGHGRSGVSAPIQVPVVPPVPAPVRVQASSAPAHQTQHVPPVQVKEVNHPGHPSRLPRAPDLTGLGLFTPPTPAPPPKPQPVPQRAAFPQERSFGGRRATVSNCQPVTLQHDPLDQAEEELMQREHKRLEDLWDEEQEKQKREVAEQRQKYEEEQMAAAARRRSEHELEQQMRSQSPSRSRGKKSARNSVPHASDSPLMNEFGVPTPPATSRSPSNKALKRPHSAREGQERWRKEIDRVMTEQRRRQDLARAEAERERLEAEEEKLRQETIKASRRQQKHGHKVRAVVEEQVKDDAMFGNPTIEVTEQRNQPFVPIQPQPRPSWGSRREQDAAAKRYARRRRRDQRDSGYLSSGSRSVHEVYNRPVLHAPPNPNYQPTRPKRFYGEGTTGLREEGQQAPPSFEKYYQPEQVVREEWRIESGHEVQDDQQVKKGRKMDEAARFAAASWELYEARWAALVTKPPTENSLRFIDIPWPSLVPLPPPSMASLPPPTPLQIAAVLNPRAVAAFILSPHHSVDKPAKARLRAALLRFHPDKVQRWMSLIKDTERASVVMGVEIVVRCLNEMMRKLEYSITA